MSARAIGAALCNLLSLVLLSVFCTVPSLAQNTNAKMIGQITDSSGAVIPEAVITAINSSTAVKYSATTDKSGDFEILSLPIGTYTVQAEKAGFAVVKSPEYTLQINQTQKVDFKLPVAGTQQAVEVSVTSSAIDIVTATVGGSVTERPLVDLPLNGRNILDLAQLQPGVTLANNPGNGSAGSVSIAGGRTDSVNYLLDGGNNSSLLSNGPVFNPNPDAVQEFRILENNYTAEYGRNGGGIISVVTKSGTQQYHGTLFEFARNTSFNANAFFNKRNGVARDDLKRHQFGGTFGGEFFIPKVLPRKDKFFYFVSYQGQRQKATVNNGLAQIATTAEAVNGDFSGADAATVSAVAAYLASNPYFQPDPVKAAKGIIDPTRFDPVAKAYIAKGIFVYNDSGTFNSRGSAKSDYNQANGRFDFAASNADHVTVTLGRNYNPSTDPFGSASTPFPITNSIRAYVANIDETHAFTPNLLNDVRAVAQRLQTTQAIPSSKLATPTELGVGITPDQSTGPTVLAFLDNNATFGFSVQGPTTLTNNTFAYTDDLSWVKGHHNLKFGGYFSPYQNNTLYDFFVDGEFQFYGLGGTASSFAQFLTGAPNVFEQSSSAPSNIRSKSYAAYAEDEWHALPNLTITYGVRYDYATPKTDTQGRSYSLVAGAQSTRFTGAPKGLLFPGDPGAPTGANFPVRNNFAPRLGFAYDVAGQGKTVVRGGAGLFYDILKGEDNLQFNGQAPFFGFAFLNYDTPSKTKGPLNIYEDPFKAAGAVNSFPSRTPAKTLDFDAAGFLPFGGGGVYFVDPHLRTPYTTQFNVGIQQDYGNRLISEITYVGSISHKYTGLADSNPFILGTSTRLFNQQNGLQIGSQGDKAYTYLDTFRNLTHANYNSLQASLRKQSTHIHYLGTTYFQASYTWAKNMDNVSGFRQRNSRVPYYNPNRFYAVADTNVTNRIVFSGGWDLPFDDLFASAPRLITKGWSVYPIAYYQSGFPLDVLAGLRRNSSRPGPTGAGDQELIRANLIGSRVAILDPRTRSATGTGAPYFSPSNFSNAVTSGYGTLSRNAFYGPGRTNVDLSFVKATTFNENSHPISFELRGDLFNLFNHAEFSTPSTTISSKFFGQITNTQPQSFRIIQLAGKLRF
ncbi:MAG: hypothetical protein NVSMB62_02760 [Acidobacteriaceae bacterium]